VDLTNNRIIFKNKWRKTLKKTLKYILFGFALIFSASIFTSCSNNTDKLYIYTWSDYFDPEVIHQFEKENKCTVIIDTFDSNEAAFAKLTAGATGYDIITPTSYIVPLMYKNGIITNFNLNLIPNVITNFDSKYSKFLISTNFQYNVPYALSITGLMYRKDIIPSGFDVESHGWWAMTNSLFKQRVTIFNDHREIIGCTLKVCGYSVNSEKQKELNDALKIAKLWKRFSSKMDNEMYKTSVASSEMLIAMGYNSDAMQVMSEDKNVGFIIPIQGTTCSFDEFCISATSRNSILAHKFVNYMYRKEIAARNVEYIFSIIPVKGIENIVDENMPNKSMAFPSEEILLRCERLNELSDKGNEKYTKMWDKIKSSK
jgi:spermidine/putrescine transport system substrate-binding protein